MKTKKFNWILTIAIAVSFLAGCTPKETPTTEATEAAAEVATEAPAAEGEKAFAGQELTMIYFDATYAVQPRKSFLSSRS